MSAWALVFLGVIAAATLATAVGQVAMFVVANRLARRIETLADHVEQEARPIFGHLNAIGRDASRATSLAATQVERFDRLVATLTERIDELLQTLHDVVVRPARDTAAIVAGFRAAMRVIREIRQNRSRAADDEEATFI